MSKYCDHKLDCSNLEIIKKCLFLHKLKPQGKEIKIKDVDFIVISVSLYSDVNIYFIYHILSFLLVGLLKIVCHK